MKGRRYLVYDVFTQERLAGNPLAVVLDAEGLNEVAMQKIAREFNYSETTFVSPPAAPRHKARVRIFTPAFELPFAGHPTVGTAIALAELAAHDGTDQLIVLEENIGLLRCAVSRADGGSFAEFDLPEMPRALDLGIEPEVVGAALGLGPHEIGFENHRVGLWTAGVPYITVPVSGMDVIGRVRLDNEAWMDLSPKRGDGKAASAYVYTRDTVRHDSSFHARMFVPGWPSYEDPATGSAAAAFSGAIARFDKLDEGPNRFWIEQGMEMGRPSRIRLEIDAEGGKMIAARIGGHAVKVAEGLLFA
ncbi:trans-2,3-dihydro-3-hydroxyanthranilate isomerase [Pseudaminobacter salicylatoxidans]|uniref:Trans-2,3-dihydro-3-hydroxyanthranilate isomerase n=1 Tax=Pseudaminobacter salicylatoxidans TaxID=93369 RepID=A0A316CPA1_PSESE|nr:PhzF family phenazine biosynthesis protein [Pseudaminobacter salicylatoxidans]PWJ84014.1 trans-2,3-dihydro-3-hydroxyanthranilate isomerase [Pseudaminobacter salicylatoxidans]